MAIDFPILTSSDNKFHTQQGKFFQNEGNNCWRRIECYMPAAPCTYHCATMEECANKLLHRLVNGELKIRRGLSSGGHQSARVFRMENGSLVSQGADLKERYGMSLENRF